MFDPPKEFGYDPSIPYLMDLYKDFPDIKVSVYLLAPAKTPEHMFRYSKKPLKR
jgi:hypothetical protein